jgi:GAF domain-containing protein
MLRSIVAAALRAIPHVHGASITLLDRSGVITTHAPSSDLVAAVDQVQVEQRDGPCIDALDEKHTDMTHAGDLGVAPPWPTFAARALEAGFHEVLSFALVADGAAGALNLYSNAPGQFDAQDELVGALLADQAAVALTGARRVGQLNEALTSRDLIGRAKGILMERFGLSDHGAFQMLVESSQTTNLKLVAVAQWLVDETEARHERPPRS